MNMIKVEGPRQPKTASPKAIARSGYLEEEYLVDWCRRAAEIDF
jgi:hypothetical protein